MNALAAHPQEHDESSRLEADYFDGRQARAHRVQARLAAGRLHLRGQGIARAVPVAAVRWPPAGSSGARLAHLPDGSSLQSTDPAAWDAWTRAGGLRASVVARAESSWRWVLGAVAALVLMAGAMYLWGLPLLARGVVALLPHSVDERVGTAALQSLPAGWLAPTTLGAEQQARVSAAFERSVQRSYEPGTAPAYTLRFHKSKLGPNAFALPGGTIVLTDELVRLVDGREDVLIGVLAHELGHVRHRHGMRSLVQAMAMGAVSSLAFGDFSGLFAGLPVLLGQAGYSRDAEREADGEAIRVLREAGLSPAVMVVFFDKIAEYAAKKGQDRERTLLGIAFASHPADADRIARFRAAAQ